MKVVRFVLVFAAGMVLGVGVALAGIQRQQRAIAWLGGFFLGLVATAFWLPAALLAIACGVGAAVDVAVTVVRRDEPFTPFTTAAAIQFALNVAVALVVRAFVVEAFKAPSSSMMPTVDIGDHFFVDKLSIHWRAPERGEVVAFRYPCDRERDYFKRVIALAGDTVEVRCNVVYVNGTAVPSALADAHASYLDSIEGIEWIHKESSRYVEHLGGHTYSVFHDVERPQRDGTHRPDARDFPVRIPGSEVPSCAMAEDAAHVEQTLGKIVETRPAATADPCEPQLHYVVPADHIFVLGDNRNNSNDSRIWGSVPVSEVKGRAVGIWYTDNPHTGAFGHVGRID